MPGKDKKKKTKGRRRPISPYAATAWGQSAGDGLHDITVPSGQLVQVQRVGPTELIKLGLLEQVDVLGALVQTEHVDRVTGRGKPPKKAKDADAERAEQMKTLMSDPAKLLSAVELIDKVICYVVVQPKVHAVPVQRAATAEDVAEYDDLELGEEFIPPRIPKGAVYIDTVELEDKMFIFQYVAGGTSDLESFRTQSDSAVASLELVKDVPDKPVKAAKRKR